MEQTENISSWFLPETPAKWNKGIKMYKPPRAKTKREEMIADKRQQHCKQ